MNYEARLDTLGHMTRAWLEMTAKEGIETWIAHGTLLGWWWNAKVCDAAAVRGDQKANFCLNRVVAAVGLGC